MASTIRVTDAERRKVLLGSSLGTAFEWDDNHHGQRQNDACGTHGVNPRSILAAAICRRMLCNINQRTTILTTGSQALQDAEDNEDNRCSYTPRLIFRQKAHEKGR